MPARLRAAAMETDDKDGAAAAAHDEAKEEGAEPKPEEEPKQAEPAAFKLDNPCRVTPAQRKFVAFEPGCRWRPIHAARPVSGILVLKDLRPGPAPLLPAAARMLQQVPHAWGAGMAQAVCHA